jgi:hypothetical protein
MGQPLVEARQNRDPAGMGGLRCAHGLLVAALSGPERHEIEPQRDDVVKCGREKIGPLLLRES